MTETSVLSEKSLLDVETAFLVALAEAGIPVDVQELITRGSLQGNIAPGALRRAIIAALKAAQKPIRPISGLSTDPICIELGEETHRYLEQLWQQHEEARAPVGDPRFNTFIVGGKND